MRMVPQQATPCAYARARYALRKERSNHMRSVMHVTMLLIRHVCCATVVDNPLSPRLPTPSYAETTAGCQQRLPMLPYLRVFFT